MSNIKSKRWDVFCKIVDNFGDIGICWRLCQQLVQEHELDVRLFIDDLFTGQKIIALLDNTQKYQIIKNIEICTWPDLENQHDLEPADIVLETFSCGLPNKFIEKMQSRQSIWINLEYLCAESWVSDFHTKASPQPNLAITKYFFFPGFLNDTGGLLRENNIIEIRDQFLDSPKEKNKLLNQLGVNTKDELSKKSINISLFCYPHANIKSLFSALEKYNRPVNLFIPYDNLNNILKNLAINSNQLIHNKYLNGSLSLHFIPFLPQHDYDKLLWICDLNFVRGEDSWVRAIWSGKPFIWQPYFQSENTHIIKMNAFLDIYLKSNVLSEKLLIKAAHLYWSSSNFEVSAYENRKIIDCSKSTIWEKLINQLPSLSFSANQVTNALAKQQDLGTKLVTFSENLRKNKV